MAIQNSSCSDGHDNVRDLKVARGQSETARYVKLLGYLYNHRARGWPVDLLQGRPMLDHSALVASLDQQLAGITDAVTDDAAREHFHALLLTYMRYVPQFPKVLAAYHCLVARCTPCNDDLLALLSAYLVDPRLKNPELAREALKHIVSKDARVQEWFIPSQGLLVHALRVCLRAHLWPLVITIVHRMESLQLQYGRYPPTSFVTSVLMRAYVKLGTSIAVSSGCGYRQPPSLQFTFRARTQHPTPSRLHPITLTHH
jgi:hypothetical protein